MRFQISQQQKEVIDLFKKYKLATNLFEQDLLVVANKIESTDNLLEVQLDKHRLTITYSKEVLFYRGLLTLFPRILQKDTATITEKTSIDEVSISLDFSRNAVMTTEGIEEYLLYLAATGINTLYLYTEDTYEVKGEPYFGYLRGRYSVEEIQKIVFLANRLGIEVVPAIQTLAHLTQFLRWPDSDKMREDHHTLLIDEERSYEAIERMINACSKMYQSKRIHLGMDEAYQAGLGRYFDLHGYTPRIELILRHLEKVITLAENAGLEPMIWSDFVYKVLDQTNTSRLYYPEAEIDLKYAEKYPKNLVYVHWDYGCEEVEQYQKVIKNHLKFCDKDKYMFATGAHIFGKIAPNHGKSINTIQAGLTACKNLGVKRSMLTTWGDDGQEIEHLHALISLYHYCEAIYSEVIAPEEIIVSMDQLMGENTYAFLYQLTYFDEVYGMLKDNPMMGNISKSILWQDPLLGIYDAHITLYQETFQHSLGSYYERFAQKITTIKIENKGILQIIKERYVCLAQILALKAELGIELQNARKSENKELLVLAQKNKINPLIDWYTKMQALHESIWHYYYKANGWEVLERRYATSISRLKTTNKKINYYLKEDKGLEELLEEKLLFCQVEHPVDFSGFNYRDTASSGYN